MIVRLPKEIEFIHCNPFVISRTPVIQKEIENVWNDFVSKKQQDVFNGDVYLVTNHYTVNDKYVIEIGKGKYSDIIYAKTTERIQTRSLFVASYISTKDGYYGFVHDNGDRLNTIGGMADNNDFDNESFIPEKCLKRELQEEIGVDLNDKSVISGYQAKFLKTTNTAQEKLPMYPIGVLYELRTDFTRSEFEIWLKNHKESAEEKDIEVVFYSSSEYEKMANYENKVSYILELFEAIINEQ